MDTFDQARAKMVYEQDELVRHLAECTGKEIYESAFTIATYSKIFNILYHNEIKCNYLADLILCNDNLVGMLTADYVNEGFNGYTRLTEFLKNKIAELHPV